MEIPSELLKFANALHRDSFERSVCYFFPNADLVAQGAAPEFGLSLTFLDKSDGTLDME